MTWKKLGSKMSTDGSRAARKGLAALALAAVAALAGAQSAQAAETTPAQACAREARRTIAAWPWASAARSWGISCAEMRPGLYGYAVQGGASPRIVMSLDLWKTSRANRSTDFRFWLAHEAGHAEQASWPSWKLAALEQATGRPLYQSYALAGGAFDWDAYANNPREMWARARSVYSSGGSGELDGLPCYDAATLSGWTAWDGK